MIKKIFILLITVMCSFNVSFARDIDVTYDNGIYHIVLKGERIKKKIRFVASPTLITNRDAHRYFRSKLTINTGFFDPKNQKTISYIVTKGQPAADPYYNENIFLNPVLRNNLDKIMNRSEFRVINCNGRYSYDIVPHNTSHDISCFIENSAQGGPMLVPDLRLEEEFFIVKDGDKVVRESASVLHKTARTLIGIKNNEAHILIITEKNPMTIYEAADLCKSLGLEKAMAFDGGSSTSLNYKKIQVVLGQTVTKGNDDYTKDSGRLLKSFMVVK
ncbi:phosphodiester glycosidase family protein [bacterium]|nr:phosphodiester glycosidase family protein [bacterium]